MPYLHNFSVTLRERLLRLFKRQENELRSQDLQQLPVVVLNDNKQDRVFTANAERTTAGSTTLLTASSEARAKTFITSISLSFADLGGAG